MSRPLTVKQLIEELQKQPDYYPVRFQTDEMPHAAWSVESVRQHSGSDGAAVVIEG